MARAEQISPYPADLDKIAFQNTNPEPTILSKSEYFNWLDQAELRTGIMSDEGILKAMESGLIKISDPNSTFDLLSQLQSASIDLRLAGHFWAFGRHQTSNITLGDHRKELEDNNMLDYISRLPGQKIVFHANRFLLAITEERVALSNVVLGHFDGRSSVARLGVTNHQTAGGIEPSFAGHIVMELSNQSDLDVTVHVMDRIATLRFEFMGSPATRIRSQKTESSSSADNQTSPFGFWKDEWTLTRERVTEKFIDIQRSLAKNNYGN